MGGFLLTSVDTVIVSVTVLGRPFVQEGQHLLTGHRAANFRLLANQ